MDEETDTRNDQKEQCRQCIDLEIKNDLKGA